MAARYGLTEHKVKALCQPAMAGQRGEVHKGGRIVGQVPCGVLDGEPEPSHIDSLW